MDDPAGKPRGILLVGAGLALPNGAQQAAPLPQLFLTPNPLSKDGEGAHRAVGGRRRGPCRCEMRPTGIGPGWRGLPVGRTSCRSGERRHTVRGTGKMPVLLMLGAFPKNFSPCDKTICLNSTNRV